MEVKINTEYIKLDQLLKFSNLVSTGGQAKEEILNGKVKLNDVVELRRGKKVYKGDIVDFLGDVIVVK